MIDSDKLTRASGLAMAAAAVLYAPLLLLDGWQSAADIGARNWWIVYMTATIHHFFLLFGLFGIFAAQLRSAGWLGIVAFVTVSLGNALVAGIGTVQVTVLPALAGNPDGASGIVCTPFYPPATRSAAGFIERACEPWSFGALEIWNAAAWISFIVGAILLGIAIVRAGVLPRIAGIALAVGWLVRLAGFVVPLPEAVGSGALLVVVAGYIGCAWGLLSGPRAAGPA